MKNLVSNGWKKVGRDLRTRRPHPHRTVGRDLRARRPVPQASRLPKSSVSQASRLPRGHQTSGLRSLISVPAVLCLLISVLCLSSFAQTWIIDGRQVQTLNLNVSDPQAARNFGTNTVYSTTNAVARWIALTNGLALEIHSSTGWVRQVEYTED
jgi:hypothetical protein